MSAETSSLDPQMLPKIPKKRSRCEAQLQRAKLPTILREHPPEQAAESGSLLGEAHGE